MTTHTRCISILTSIVCSAPRDFAFGYGQWLKRVLRQLMETCCFCADEQSSVFAAQCIGGIVNRMDDGKIPIKCEYMVKEIKWFFSASLSFHQRLLLISDFFSFIEKIVKEGLSDLLDHPELAKARSQEWRFTRVVVWITNGLILRSHHDTEVRRLTEMIIERLKSQKSGVEAAEGLRVIMEESPFVLTPRMNAVISPLYRQKFFLQTLPMLLQSFDQNNEPDKAWAQRNHLVGWSHLLRYVPQSVTKAFMPKVPTSSQNKI